ncbi:hypothetical protein ACPA9J_31550 [Pseudomonas aeruginosa]
MQLIVPTRDRYVTAPSCSSTSACGRRLWPGAGRRRPVAAGRAEQLAGWLRRVHRRPKPASRRRPCSLRPGPPRRTRSIGGKLVVVWRRRRRRSTLLQLRRARHQPARRQSRPGSRRAQRRQPAPAWRRRMPGGRRRRAGMGASPVGPRHLGSDVVVSNAGIGMADRCSTSPAEWERLLRVNLWA